MDQRTENPTFKSHPRFAAYYERTSRGRSESFMEPLRRATAGAASGAVLEIGAGNGLNFAFYQPGQVEHVEAIEPDQAMRTYAQQRADAAPVPLTLSAASAEELPFAADSFDSVVVTMVFCSVGNPMKGLAEIRRVLKPGGRLLMLEHVRAHNPLLAGLQNVMTPFTRRFAGNCHWNRDTARAVQEAGFQVVHQQSEGGGLLPMISLEAQKAREPLSAE